jgi:hypothetical protein
MCIQATLIYSQFMYFGQKVKSRRRMVEEVRYRSCLAVTRISSDAMRVCMCVCVCKSTQHNLLLLSTPSSQCDIGPLLITTL